MTQFYEEKVYLEITKTQAHIATQFFDRRIELFIIIQ